MAENRKGYVNPQLLIDPNELAGRLGVPSGSATGQPLKADANTPVLIDLRPAEVFATGHIPGAVHLDLFGLSLVDTNSAPLDAFLWIIAHLLTTRGVDGRRTVVVYDDQSGIRAARAFWFLELFGHQDACLLDGGVGAWERDGFFTTTEATLPNKAKWNVGRVDARLATWRDLHERLGQSEVVILDTRSDGEYFGATVRAKRGGAVPGAVHVEWTNNLDSNGEFKSASDLVALYEAAGVTVEKEVVSYCQGGYRAAHSYLALRLIGYPRVRNYIGSWKEWGDREDLPVEMPAKNS
ncbi:MAG: sulfurtransferase [Acidobacteriota bacterium]|nr:sulfurtransferase [Acidobacteriota bacterium]